MTPTPEQVKRARKAAGLTQAAAAERAGLGSRTRWAEYESGTRRMPRYRLKLFKLMSTGEKK